MWGLSSVCQWHLCGLGEFGLLCDQCRMRVVLTFLLLCCATPALAEPRDVAVGDPMRRALLDAIRPQAEEVLGAPVLFRVIELMVEGDRGFARLYAERPDGVAIDLATTPAVQEMGWSLDLFDGPRFEVFYHHQNGAWGVVRWEVGATDAWWFGYDCVNYGQFYEQQACR